ncbi:MarR family winged helix-turn-helix transcriptional regulator [Desulforamulus ruminis]|uniref:Regulatory protein MarR n=1 Tax=Desulforamulus ruminis (strain ATCC 23193 / DSM 2154 / NCIMB 8452 / DL) TaxID=696281 RepID=F6DR26_DESRL|nr:MarR family transcriptional regulator [Desulforamulus ruminis]AEG59745.1 regulatory protein MarR [Desulforamulus ruminis DSM 2154]
MDEHSLAMIELELTILLRRASFITHHHRAGNLDRSAYLLLHQIITHGSAGIKALADEFRLDISTVCRQAAALEQKGYVYRIPNPVDGRAYSLQITDSGIKAYDQHRQARLARITDIVKDWSDEDCEMFGRLLRKYNRSVIHTCKG